MIFFMFFCDNHLKIINTLDKPLQQRIEDYEQARAKVKSEKDFNLLREELSAIIKQITATLRSNEKRLLQFIGGLVMIRDNMFWKDGEAHNTDINDNGQLV